jgi:glycosyltransferase involved in cell wall biosynthesis
VGDGPLRASLEARAAGLPITFTGGVAPARAQEEIANARLLILPSRWFEGFPMVIREAYAFGTPVAASSIGPLPQIVTQGAEGVHFEPDNARSLYESVSALWANPDELARMGAHARTTFARYYTEEANYETLMSIYESAIERNRLAANG